MSKPALIIAAALLALAAASPSVAQGPARAPARGAPPAAAQPPGPPPVFPCRTASEVCYLGVVVGSQVLVLFTNAPNGQDAGAKPIDVAGADGAKLDLAPHAGRVVMLTGTFDPAAGLKGAELVEVASPLASLVVKAQLGGGGDEGPPKPAAGAPRRR